MRLHYLACRVPLMKALILAILLCFACAAAWAHGVAEGDKGFIEQSTGPQLVAFIYLGAKHMVTGYDHLLFLLGVIFFLYRMRDVGLYVTLFAIGHSVTLLSGVLLGIHANPYLIDALIGVSVIYKALDNLNGFERWFGFKPDARGAVLIFGLAHGFGLATKLQEFSLSPNGLVANILAFNVGVEFGQILALGLMLIGMVYLRRSEHFSRNAYAINTAIMTAGFQLTGFFIHR
jgi:hypothetical protein